MNIILLSMNFIMWTCRSSVGVYWHDFPFHIILCSLIAVRLFQHCYFSHWILLVTVKRYYIRVCNTRHSTTTNTLSGFDVSMHLVLVPQLCSDGP